MDTIWLKEDGGRGVFFPDTSNSHFGFNSDVGLFTTRLLVEGSDGSATSTTSTAASGSRVLSTVGSTKHPPPLFSKKFGQSVNVKIIQAIKLGIDQNLSLCM